MKVETPRNLADLSGLLQGDDSVLFRSSQTSTVLPFSQLDAVIPKDLKGLRLIDLNSLESKMKMEGDDLRISGAVNWKEASEFLKNHGCAIKTSPTEELASVLAGVATGCTGERSFSFGPMRDQIKELKALDSRGEEMLLKSSSDFPHMNSAYKKSLEPYRGFKNPPFPRFETEVDLLIGTEGQLGVVTECLLETTQFEQNSYLFLLLPRWEDSLDAHLELLEKVQDQRNLITSIELLDSNSLSFLPAEMQVGDKEDVVVLEFPQKKFEKVFSQFISSLTLIPEDKIFEINQSKYHQMRKSIPRYVAEKISRENILKKGTDTQVKVEAFASLMKLYQKASKLGVPYLCFGHFGDAHLHFNFLPAKDQVKKVETFLKEFYQEVIKLKGSPFAEHGIGVLKQHFIRPFYQEAQFEMFEQLKSLYDPQNKLFPFGFMSMEKN